MFLEIPLHTEKCTVWSGIYPSSIIGFYFFKNGKGANVTINGSHYCAIINDYFFQNISDIYPDEFWFPYVCRFNRFIEDFQLAS